MILRKLANFIDFRFLHVCVQSAYNFFFKFWEMIETIKTDVDRLLLVSKFKKSSIVKKYIENFFFIVKTKSSLSMSVFIFSAISQILQTAFYVFCTQTCRNWTKSFTWTCYFSQVSHGLKRSKYFLNVKNQFSWIKEIIESEKVVSKEHMHL